MLEELEKQSIKAEVIEMTSKIILAYQKEHNITPEEKKLITSIIYYYKTELKHPNAREYALQAEYYYKAFDVLDE